MKRYVTAAGRSSASYMGMMAGCASAICRCLEDPPICATDPNGTSVRNAKGTTTQTLEWHHSNSPHAIIYDEHILLQLVNATIEDVAMKEGLAYDSVLGALERQVDEKVKWSRYTKLKRLGLDEIALKKGHRDFVVIVTARLEDERVHSFIVMTWIPH